MLLLNGNPGKRFRVDLAWLLINSAGERRPKREVNESVNATQYFA